jgi:hypothetical protein
MNGKFLLFLLSVCISLFEWKILQKDQEIKVKIILLFSFVFPYILYLLAVLSLLSRNKSLLQTQFIELCMLV